MGTVFDTVVAGTLVLALGQIVQRFFLDPIQKQHKTIGQVAFNLVYLANVSDAARLQGIETVQIHDALKATKTLRALASQLRASLWTIPFYDALAFFRLVRKREAIFRASRALVGWSNTTHGHDSEPHREAIAEALKIKWKGDEAGKHGRNSDIAFSVLIGILCAGSFMTAGLVIRYSWLMGLFFVVAGAVVLVMFGATFRDSEDA
jgi:hypothetical protein